MQLHRCKQNKFLMSTHQPSFYLFCSFLFKFYAVLTILQQNIIVLFWFIGLVGDENDNKSFLNYGSCAISFCFSEHDVKSKSIQLDLP